MLKSCKKVIKMAAKGPKGPTKELLAKFEDLNLSPAGSRADIKFLSCDI